jgi:flagellar motility protein MotE (MotC chaperone)
MGSSYNDFFEKAQKTKGVKKLSPAPRRNVKQPAVYGRKKNDSIIVGLMVCGFLTTLAGTFYYEELEKIFSKIDISVFSKAAAEEVGSKSTDLGAVKSEGNAVATTAKSDAVAPPEAGNPTKVAAGKDSAEVELDHFARLRERKIELDKREEELNKLEAELGQQRIELEQKLKDLEGVRRNISSVLEEKVQADDQKVENLVQFYSNMKPPQAAKIIETLDEDLAVQVIAKMKKTNAANIMNLLPPVKAQSISEKYVGYKK